MDYQIRPARISDKKKILSIIDSYHYKWDKDNAEKYYNDYFSKTSQLKGDMVYVLTLEEKLIGVIGYSIDRYETDNYWMGWFYVHKEYEGRKFGTKLLNYVLDKLRKKRKRKLFVTTSSHKHYKKALNLYLKKGFKFEALIRDYYSKGDDQLILSKTIL